MNDPRLEAIREWIQEDPCGRGLRTDPARNLVTVCAPDFCEACGSLAAETAPVVAVVTGFLIPHAQPPCGETDGPLGAVFLARALSPLGARVLLVTDRFCRHALEAGLAACGLRRQVPVLTLPAVGREGLSLESYWQAFSERTGRLTHLVALERVGPSHTASSVEAQPGGGQALAGGFLDQVPAGEQDRCYTMKGVDITEHMSPAHLLFERAARQTPGITTIGIGDGGNEIGMGKISWDIIRRNIPGGARIACRVPANHLIVSGVSNWGAYGLAAGVALLRGRCLTSTLLDPSVERKLLQTMVEQGPLVDGVSGQPTVSVDGLDFDRYAVPLERIGQLGS